MRGTALRGTGRICLAISLALSLFAFGLGQEPRFEKDIQAFEAQDAQMPPPPGGVVFVGSSSIRLWKTVSEDFPGTPCINRGFGGSEVIDSVRFARRIVTPYRPSLVVFFAGTNDLAAGKSPETVAADFFEFVRIVKEDVPGVRVAYISITPAPLRWSRVPEMRRANALIQARCLAEPDLLFVDVFRQMLGPGGVARPELFTSDRLHMNDAGYEVWRAAVRPVIAWGQRG